MYPLITNDRTLTAQQMLESHKGQPRLEKRFEQLKTVHEIAPVFLKNPARIEAFFTVHFLALPIQALIDRERLKSLPLYPEERRCAHPTTEQVLRLFSHAERHLFSRAGRVVQCFEADFTPLQRQVLDLLGVPAAASGADRPTEIPRNHLRDVRKVRLDISVGQICERLNADSVCRGMAASPTAC